MFAPVVIFVYDRLSHLKQTVDGLRLNEGADETDIIFYSDAAKSAGSEAGVSEVREYLASLAGFRSIKVLHREVNYGLAKSIIEGVTEVLQQYESVIVLEDDMLTSPYFLKYMNDGLEFYSSDDRVVSLHAYRYPVTSALPETFFLLGADCWGWATWRRGWKLFNSDGAFLLDELKRRKLVHQFDFNGAYPYSGMLRDQVEGRNSSWAIRWYASAFLAGKFTLYPGISLIHNIGNDESGTHCANTDLHDVEVSSTALNVGGIDVADSPIGRQAFEEFFRAGRVGVWTRIRRKLNSFFR